MLVLEGLRALMVGVEDRELLYDGLVGCIGLLCLSHNVMNFC